MTSRNWLAGIGRDYEKPRKERDVVYITHEADVSMETLRRIAEGRPVSDEAVKKLSDAMNIERELLPGRAKELFGQKKQEYFSVFISFGGPDEEFAKRLWEDFESVGVKSFFFPKSAQYGERLHRTMSQGVTDYDRVVLICSEASLTRPGVLNEIEQILSREAAEGGAELLIPITLDSYVYNDWEPKRSDLGRQIRNRVIGDFRDCCSKKKFDAQMRRLLQALWRDNRR